MGSNSKVGSGGCPQGVSARPQAWIFFLPLTTCWLLSWRHLLALRVGDHREPLEMVEGLEGRHPLSRVAVAAVLGRRRRVSRTKPYMLTGSKAVPVSDGCRSEPDYLRKSIHLPVPKKGCYF